jgi:RND family efflux transporter MFP subunit
LHSGIFDYQCSNYHLKLGHIVAMKKYFFTVLFLLGVSFLGWQIYQNVNSDKKAVKRQRKKVPVAVEIAPIQQATVQDIGRYSGSLYPSAAFIMAPKISGRLEKIWVNIGDELQSSQLIAALDDAEYKQQVSQAKAELEVARANLLEQENALENANREYERAVALREKKIASESELDASLSELKAQGAKLKVAIARVAQSEAAMRVANVRLAYTQIHVPDNNSAGYRVVGERFVDEGAMLASNTPIVSIIDIGKLIAAIHVIEQDYPKISVGQEATVSTDAFPERSFSGKVVRIAPILKEKSREARIEIEIPNPQKILKPGMFVRAQIQFEKHENATVVPTAAVIKRNNSQGVFIVDPDGKTARFVPVTLGIVDSKIAEIRTPVMVGSVVVLGQHLLEDRAYIIIPDNQVTGSQPAKGKKNHL